MILESIERDEKRDLPLIVIAGKPNVGKSTLFNRLVGRRRAITHSDSGVTRDPVRIRWKYESKEAYLIDTGGIRSDETTGLTGLVIQKSIETLRKADCIILVASIEGITGEDEELFERLRPFADKIVLAVNKVDTEKRETALADFYGLGYGDPVPISAAHDRNCKELADRIFSFLEGKGWEFGEETSPELEQITTLAVLGKPNTGKSTLVNRLLGKEISIVSDIPGTTRDVVEDTFRFKDHLIRILDTGGIRRKTKVKEDVEYYSVHRALERIRETDVVFLLIDAAEGLSEQDKKISAQVVKKGRGILLVLNKWDEVKGGRKKFLEVKEYIRFQFPVLDFAPIVPISAKTGWNLEALLQEAFHVHQQLGQRVETSLLNRSLAEWIEENPLPQSGKKKFKIRFITQVSIRPIRFVLFVNRKEDFPSHYIGYIRNKIREVFNLPSVPIEIELKARDSTR
ncbi:MAG TPA: ribosome biogenesis GTPase Der [Spirochaetales bacterium]|mgnify:CR=1 FL=1|nr:ribosome biogenesis GTPase Der [Spirochaetales bacterium]